MQCWDDGVSNDERLTELLRKYNAKATFNIIPGLHGKSRIFTSVYGNTFKSYRLALDEMKDIYKGFKVAGHSMTHPKLAELDAQTLEREIVDCKDFIQNFFGQQECGFAYPYGNYNDAVKQALANAGYRYARTVKNINGALPLDDPMELPSHCHFLNPDFWKKYEEVRAIDGIFYFWGHSYEMMDDPKMWDEFESKLDRIKSDSKAQWIDIIDLFV